MHRARESLAGCGIAQPGRAPVSYSGGREFESPSRNVEKGEKHGGLVDTDRHRCLPSYHLASHGRQIIHPRSEERVMKKIKTSRQALLFECPKCYKLAVAYPPDIPYCGGIISRSPNFSTEHETITMGLLGIVDAQVAGENIDWGMMANDIGEAIEENH